MQDEWTVGFAQRGVDPVNTNVAVCGGLPGGQSQLGMNRDDVFRIHGKILLVFFRLYAFDCNMIDFFLMNRLETFPNSRFTKNS